MATQPLADNSQQPEAREEGVGHSLEPEGVLGPSPPDPDAAEQQDQGAVLKVHEVQHGQHSSDANLADNHSQEQGLCGDQKQAPQGNARDLDPAPSSVSSLGLGAAVGEGVLCQLRLVPVSAG